MSDCYVKHDDGVFRPSDHADWPQNFQCSNGSGIQTCCAVGDECGRDGFCYFSHENDAPLSRYYLGGCTDPAFEDPVCPQSCTSYGTQDVVYDSRSGLWSCCWGNDGLDCRTPGNETFAADEPAQLFAATSASSVAAATSSSTSVRAVSTASAVPSQTSRPATSPSPSPSSNTTTIAVATVVPIVVVLAALLGLLFWWRRRAKKRRGTALTEAQARDHGQAQEWPGPEQGQEQVRIAEKNPYAASPVSGELSADRERAELSESPSKEGVGDWSWSARESQLRAELPT